MFIRRKRNRSGSTGAVVVDKSHGGFRELKTPGVSTNEKETAELCLGGRKWISIHCGDQDMFCLREREEEEKQATEHLLSCMENILPSGTQLILDQVFKTVGFDQIEDNILKQLVIARLCQAGSKAGTADYSKSHFDEDVELHRIYRYLDKLRSMQKDQVQQISVEHTRKIPGGKTGLVFYDATTLYFETDSSDELRKTGYSKDGRHSQSQIVLGLPVSSGGYPSAYSIHEGNKYEGHTMLPVIEDFVKEFHLKDVVVVADSGLMNSGNISLLEEGEYKYIPGDRIKNGSNK